MKPLIAPSLLSADFLHLGDALKMINRSEADWIHLDIMDGLFVPNISFGFPVLDAIKREAEKPMDVHLMITNPDRYIERFRESGASFITVHYETCPHLHRTLQAIRSTGANAGVSLNPHTPVSLLADILLQVDLVLLMSVNPGFGGQQFIPQTYQRIRQLHDLIRTTGSQALIEIDGGVTLQNASLLAQAGAEVLVAGNTVFSSPDPSETIRLLKSCHA